MLQWLNCLLLWYCGVMPPFVDSQASLDPVRNTLRIWSRLLGRMAQQQLPSDDELHFKVDENNLLGIKDLFPDDLFPTIAPGFTRDEKDFGMFQRIPFIWTTSPPLFGISTQSTPPSSTFIPPTTEKVKKLRLKRKKLREKHRNSSSSAHRNSSSIFIQSTLAPNPEITSPSPSTSLSPLSSLRSSATTAATIVTDKIHSKLSELRKSVDKSERDRPQKIGKMRMTSEEMRESVAETIVSEIMKRIVNLNKNGTNSEQRIFIKIRSQDKEEKDEDSEDVRTAMNETIHLSSSDSITIKSPLPEALINFTDLEISNLSSKKRIQDVMELEESVHNISKENSTMSKINFEMKQNFGEDESKEEKNANDEADYEFEYENSTETISEQKQYSTTAVSVSSIATTSLPYFFSPHSPSAHEGKNNRSVLVPVNDIIDGIGPLILPMFAYRPQEYHPAIPNTAAGARTYNLYEIRSQPSREYEEPTILSLGRAIVRQIYGMRANQYDGGSAAAPPNKYPTWPSGHINENSGSLYRAWPQQPPVVSSQAMGAQAQRAVRNRHAPVAQPLPQQHPLDRQVPNQQDLKMSGMEYRPMIPSRVTSTTSSNRFRNVPYRRYVPRPSEYERAANWATGVQLAPIAAPAHTAPYTMYSAASPAIPRVPSSAGFLSYSPNYHYLEPFATLSPEVDMNLLSQLYSREFYQKPQQSQQQLQTSAPEVAISISENSRSSSIEQVYDGGDGYSMGRSKVRSDFFGDTGLLVDNHASSSGNVLNSSMSSEIKDGIAEKSQAEYTPFTPPPNHSNKNSGGFGVGRGPEKSFDELFPSK